MKVVLLEDVKGQGKKGEIVKVSDGYAKNYLIPKNLAKEATEQIIKDIESKKQAEAFKQSEEKKSALSHKEILEKTVLVFNTTGGIDGKLYSAVTGKDVAEKIKADLGLDIDKKKIVINETIKTMGEYTVTVKLFPGIQAKLSLKVQN
ncbi:MAG: 50S ribosomal protein L9 [Clostridiales bacterium]|jgi:large subunit ribosomal protein L9|nr:50S ribosomal protein L9 [Clostridiales bacterium]